MASSGSGSSNGGSGSNGGNGGMGSGGNGGMGSGGNGGMGSGGNGGMGSGGNGGNGGMGSGGNGGMGSGGGMGSSGGCAAACTDAGIPSACPSALPTAGHACAPSGLECEYGKSTVEACNSVATCGSSGWQIRGSSTTANCAAGVGPQCPASYASVLQNTHCANFGLDCDYAMGRCACAVLSGPVVLDASAAARWICQEPAMGCPKPRAPLGSPCAQDGLFCDYGTCSIAGGSAEQCTGGIWKTANTACPL